MFSVKSIELMHINFKKSPGAISRDFLMCCLAYLNLIAAGDLSI